MILILFILLIVLVHGETRMVVSDESIYLFVSDTATERLYLHRRIGLGWNKTDTFISNITGVNFGQQLFVDNDMVYVHSNYNVSTLHAFSLNSATDKLQFVGLMNMGSATKFCLPKRRNAVCASTVLFDGTLQIDVYESRVKVSTFQTGLNARTDAFGCLGFDYGIRLHVVADQVFKFYYVPWFDRTPPFGQLFYDSWKKESFEETIPANSLNFSTVAFRSCPYGECALLSAPGNVYALTTQPYRWQRLDVPNSNPLFGQVAKFTTRTEILVGYHNSTLFTKFMFLDGGWMIAKTYDTYIQNT